MAVNKGQCIMSDISVKDSFPLWLTLSHIDGPPIVDHRIVTGAFRICEAHACRYVCVCVDNVHCESMFQRILWLSAKQEILLDFT